MKKKFNYYVSHLLWNYHLQRILFDLRQGI